MTRPFLFTSLPPSMNRFDRDGRNIGYDYQRRCIASWIDCGFDVCSINAPQEEIPQEFAKLVRVEKTERDASEIAGKPLPYLQDMIDVIVRVTAGSGGFALTNADILLSSETVDISESVRTLRPQECIVEPRMDFAVMDKISEGSLYPSGFDFFAFRAEDARSLSLNRFVFGRPWWDYALPLSACFQGWRRKRIESPFAFHMLHDERWDRKSWTKFGDCFLDEIVLPRAGRIPPDRFFVRYANEVAPQPLNSGFKTRTLKNILNILGFGSRQAMLGRLARLNIDALSRW
jgi:hypothetical protein